VDTRPSFYLACRKDDFAEPAADLSTIDSTDIPYVMPANDNAWTKDRLSARCGALLRRYCPAWIRWLRDGIDHRHYHRDDRRRSAALIV
jgi:hypothetical protein